MPETGELLVVPASAGIDTGRDPKQVSDAFLRVDNGRWAREGEIRKRHGTSALTGTFANDLAMAEYNGKPVLIGNDLRIGDGTTFDYAGPTYCYDLEVQRIYDEGFDAGIEIEMAQNGSYRLVGYQPTGSYCRFYIQDLATGIITATFPTVVGASARCLLIGSILYYFYVDDSSHKVRYGTVTATGTFNAPADVPSTAVLGSTLLEVCLVSSVIVMLAYQNNASPVQTEVAMFNTSTSTSSIFVTTKANDVTPRCVAKWVDNSVGVLVFFDATVRSVYAIGLSMTATVAVTEAVMGTFGATGFPVVTIAYALSATSLPIFTGYYDSAGSLVTEYTFVNYYLNAAGVGSAGTPAMYVRGALPAGRPFYDTAGRWWACYRYGPEGGTDGLTRFAPTRSYIVLDLWKFISDTYAFGGATMRFSAQFLLGVTQKLLHISGRGTTIEA